MKILVTADIHDHSNWYEWLLNEAPKYDLLVIAGDVLNMFSGEKTEEQIVRFLSWHEQFQTLGIPMALCSGNHDAATEPYSGALNNPELKQLYFYEHWMESLKNEQCVVSPETRLLKLPNGQSVVISALHWYFMSGLAGANVMDQLPELKSHIEGMLKEGKRLARENQCPWLWLHHEPPCTTRLTEESLPEDYLHQLLVIYEPDVLCSGHWHMAPFNEGGSYRDYVENTLCLNPGHIEQASTPCCVSLHWADGEWQEEHLIPSEYKNHEFKQS